METYIHAYIHNWSQQFFSQDYNRISHIIYDVCVNFIHELQNQHFKVDFEQQIFEKLFTAILITLRITATNLQ